MKKYISIEDISYRSGDIVKVHWEGGGFMQKIEDNNIKKKKNNNRLVTEVVI